MTNLPPPLTPADCDLRGMQWMPLDTMRVLDSDLFLNSTGDEFKAAFALWCKSWQQVPAGSLPNNEKSLAGLSLAKNWKKVRDVAMRGWILCSDNRYYHEVVAEKALEALPARKEFESKKSADALRKERERSDRKALFELLREHKIVPPYDTKTSQLRELAKPFAPPPDTPSSVTTTVTGSVTGHTPVTAKTGTGEGQGELLSVPTGTDATASGTTPPPPPATPPEPPAATKKERSPEDIAKAEVWRAAVSVLAQGGCENEAQARTFMGKLVKDHTFPVVKEAVAVAVTEQPADAREYLKATCMRLAGARTSTKASTTERRVETLQGLAGDTPLTGESHENSDQSAIDVESRVIA